MKKLAILITALILFTSFTEIKPKECIYTTDGPAIEWSENTNLKWSDFKARNKPVGGFAIAASTCGFGYDGIISGDEVTVNVYVRFYCNESWRDNNYLLDEVLQHEQLHFDICELYGRIFYKNILFLRKSGSLTERTLKKTLHQVRDDYDTMQNRYDAETNHSTDSKKQKEWNAKIKHALDQHAAYANYKEF